MAVGAMVIVGLQLHRWLDPARLDLAIVAIAGLLIYTGSFRDRARAGPSGC